MRVRWGIGVAMAAVVVLGLTAGCGVGRTSVIIDGPFGSPGGPTALQDTVGRSDYLLIGRVTTSPSKAEHYDSGAQDWTVQLVVTEVVAQRPSVNPIVLGETVKLVVETVDGHKHPEITNYGDFEASELALADRPKKGNTIVAFARVLSSSDGPLRLLGHAVLSEGDGPVTILGFNLRGVPPMSRDGLTAALVPAFASPRS